jgi:hypothetical protein
LVAVVTWPNVSTLQTALHLLLDALALENHPIAARVPIDLSREQLAEVASRIAAECPCSAIQPG